VPVEELDEATVDEPFPIGEGPANGGWLPTPSAAYLLLEADGYIGAKSGSSAWSTTSPRPASGER
jgi:hypothetical protein